MDMQPKYKRILLKLSGEALAGRQGFGLDQDVIAGVVDQIVEVHSLGVEVGLVIGRRKFLAGEAGHQDGPHHRRPHGHARHRDEFPGDDGRHRTARRAGAGADGAEHGLARRAVHPAQGDTAFRRGADRHLRVRHGQSLLFDGTRRRRSGRARRARTSF